MTRKLYHFSSFFNRLSADMFYLLSHLTSNIVCSIAFFDD